MKVLFLGYMHGFGGAERAMVLASNALAADHEVTIISLTDEPIKYELDGNVTLINIDYRKGKVYILKELYSIFCSINPEVVISFWMVPAFLSILLKPFFVYKTVYAERGDPSDREYSGLLGIIRDITFNYIDEFIFQTNVVMYYFKDSIRRRSRVIPNMVDVKGIEKKEYENRVKKIINVGRLSEQKNQKLLIKSFAICHQRYRDIELHIFGDGILKNDLIEEAKDNNVDDCVFFHEPKSNIFEEMKKYDMFVLSSDYEGMPNVLLEAMAIGLPSISTNYMLGGVNEIIADGFDGLISERRNSNDLAQKMNMFLSNSSFAKQCGENGKISMKRFSKENNVKSWNQFIKKMETYYVNQEK